MQSLTKQQGAAIIVALFIVALVAAAATLMVERIRTDIHRTQLILTSTKAYLYAQGSVAWAIDQLNKDWVEQKKDQVVDFTPIKSPTDKKEGFTISSTIFDAQGLFNLNNLTNADYQPNFTRLISIVAPEIDPSNAQYITVAVSDWISATSKNLILDEYYLKLTPSYRASHRLMYGVSELRLIKGMTPELYTKLLPYVIALPKATPINVNNAPEPVLMSLSMTMSLQAAKAIRAVCQESPFPSPEKFKDFDIVKNNPINATKITVLSNYFLLQTNVTLGNQRLVLYTLLERVTQDKKSQTIVLWQSQGTL